MSYESDMKALPIKASRDFYEANIADTYRHVAQEDANQDAFDQLTIRYELLQEQAEWAEKIRQEIIGAIPSDGFDALDKLVKLQADYIDRLKEQATKLGLL